MRLQAAIGQQLVMVQNDPASAEFAEKTVAYAGAKTVYLTALRKEMPELINTATRRKLRPLQLDNFIRAFSVAGEKQEKAVDKKTVTFLERLSGNADVEKARAEFERAQSRRDVSQGFRWHRLHDLFLWHQGSFLRAAVLAFFLLSCLENIAHLFGASLLARLRCHSSIKRLFASAFPSRRADL